MRSHQVIPDAAQRFIGAPLIRDRKQPAKSDPVSAKRHDVRRIAHGMTAKAQ